MSSNSSRKEPRRGESRRLCWPQPGRHSQAASAVFEGTAFVSFSSPGSTDFVTPSRFPRTRGRASGKRAPGPFRDDALSHRGILRKQVPQLMANLLRIFGQGIKVCVEIILMACDGDASISMRSDRRGRLRGWSGHGCRCHGFPEHKAEGPSRSRILCKPL